MKRHWKWEARWERLAKRVAIAAAGVMLLLVAPSGQAQETPRPAEVKTNPVDGAEMVWVPAGHFLMGNDQTDLEAATTKLGMSLSSSAMLLHTKQEIPRHKVEVSGFWMYKHEVTVAQFRKFVEATGYQTDVEKGKGALGIDGGFYYDGEFKADENVNWRHPQGRDTNAEDNHPVVQVSWNDAVAYYKWAGVRLPTEAEWEYAARDGNTGMDGKPHHVYVWGDELPQGKGRYGNLADDTAKERFPAGLTGLRTFEGYDDGYVFTSPVGSFDANGFGLKDMEGNVAEWCADWYDEKYYANSPTDDPQGPTRGSRRVARGGSWQFHRFVDRVAYRHPFPPEFRGCVFGFRCVASVGG